MKKAIILFLLITLLLTACTSEKDKMEKYLGYDDSKDTSKDFSDNFVRIYP